MSHPVLDAFWMMLWFFLRLHLSHRARRADDRSVEFQRAKQKILA